MSPSYLQGGDAYDIARDPNLVIDEWKCPQCGKSWQNRRHQLKENRPVDPRCPGCGGLLVDYWDYQRGLRRKGSWRLFSTEMGVAALLGLAGWALFHFLDAGLARDAATLVLSGITLYLAFFMRARRIYDDTRCYYLAGDLWPSKAGFLALLVLGLLFSGLFINEIFHLF